MKKHFLSLCSLAIALSACSNNNDTPVDTTVEAIIEITPGELIINSESRTTSLNVSSNTEWSVSSDVAWCKPLRSGGIDGDTNLKLQISENSDSESRETNLTFRSGSFVKPFLVKQFYKVIEVNIPDNIFLNYLINNFDTNGDKIIDESEVLLISQINVDNLGIESLEGIHKMTGLKSLSCKGNNISDIDISTLLRLESLQCSENKLSELKLRNNLQLSALDCTGNPDLTAILVWSGFQGSDKFLKPEKAIYVEPEIVTPSGYRLVWNQEFGQSKPGVNSLLPDSDEWWYETGNNGWGNNELQNYIAGFRGTDTCAVVSNGTLKIIAKQVGSEVYSIRMNTKKSWTYGYFEARLKLPKGKGTWPAFWMMPQNYTTWPGDGEIDIMEEVGYRPDYVSASIHCNAYNHKIGTQKTAERYVTGAQSDFHIYALEWTEDFIKGYIDGVCFFTFNNDKKNNYDSWPFFNPFYIKLNLAWGGDWGGSQGIDQSALPCTYEIDYVRVFQK